MANSLTEIIPRILARGLLHLRRTCVLPRMVNLDYSTEAKEKGDTIDVTIASAVTASDVTPSNTPPAPGDSAPTKVQIQLNKWKHADFHLTDKQKNEIMREKSFMPGQMSAALDALAGEVNADIFAKYKGVYGAVGTAGTTPFGGASPDSAFPADIVNARKLLNKQLAVRMDRRVVLDHDAYANALRLPAFRDASQSGDKEVVQDGAIGKKYGFPMWADDDQVPTHTAGTASGYLINNGAGYAIGTTTLVIDTGTGTWVEGDIVTFAGHAQQYAVQSGTTTQLVLKRGLVASVADNAAITKVATHVVNLAFQKDAFAFASRSLGDEKESEFERLAPMMSIGDPVSGLNLRLEVMRQYKQTVWDFDILWGAQLIRPEFAVRILG
jgi:hypothetical protein